MNFNNIAVVLMAGGFGTRMSEDVRFKDTPKCLIEIDGMTLLERQIENFSKFGIRTFILSLHHDSVKIKKYIRDIIMPKYKDITIYPCTEHIPLGTGGGLIYSYNRYETILKIRGIKEVIVTNCDLYIDIDIFEFSSIITKHRISQNDITLLIHRSNHVKDSTLIDVNLDILGKDKNIEFNMIYHKGIKKPNRYFNYTFSGISVIKKEFLDAFCDNYGGNMETSTKLDKFDFDNVIIPCAMFINCISNHKVIGVHDVKSFIFDVGTPDRYDYIVNNLDKIKKYGKEILFLDRDGTLIEKINHNNGYITKPEEVIINKDIIKVIREANENGKFVVIASNQPQIAMGMLDEYGLGEIHKEIETKLAEYNIYIDDFYYCPHRTEKGYFGENLKYKVFCNCRKPNIGMFEYAFEKYGNLKSKYIGDSDDDKEAANKLKTKYKVEYIDVKDIKNNNSNNNNIDNNNEIELKINKIVLALNQAYYNGKKILICGNGGSASDADHIVAELMKNFNIDRYYKRRRLFDIKALGKEMKLNEYIRAFNLCSQSALITAIANDIGYDYIYSQQVFGYGDEGDILICLSTSGKSKNIINAAKVAKEKGMKVLSISGKDKTDLDKYSSIIIHIDKDSAYEVQNETVKIYHDICKKLEKIIWG